VVAPDGSVLERVGEGIGVATNNVAEYRAALRGVSVASEHGATTVLLRSDSKLLVEQLAGRWRVKNPTLIRLHQEVREATRNLEHVAFEHVPREQNREADALANRGVDEWLAGPGAGYVRPDRAPELFGR
jgi:ribonuclease HI